MNTAGPGRQGAVDPRGQGPRGARPNVSAVEAMYQLVLWLVPLLEGLPRSQKFQLGDRVQNAALDVLALLIEAAYSRDRVGLLRQANVGLEKLRFWLRLLKDLKHFEFARYEHAVRLVDEVGKQVGGWLKQASHHAQQSMSSGGPRGQAARPSV